MSLENIELFGLICLTGLVLLPIFAAPVMIPKLLRAYRLRTLAKKYNLHFRMKFWSNITFADMPDHMEQNIMEGILKGKRIRIYDSFDINNSISNPLMLEAIYGKNSSKPYTRRSILEIEGEKEIIKGSFVFPFASVRKIALRLEEVQ
jgi:hypothetical protein